MSSVWGRSIWPWATRQRAGGAGSGAAHGGGGVAAGERVWDACARGEVPRGGPVVLEGSPGPFGRGRAVDEVHRRRTAGGGRNRASREERDGGEGISAISEIPGTCR